MRGLHPLSCRRSILQTESNRGVFLTVFLGSARTGKHLRYSFGREETRALFSMAFDLGIDRA
jgi:hypothetical protein